MRAQDSVAPDLPQGSATCGTFGSRTSDPDHLPRRDRYLSHEPDNWIKYEKNQLRLVLGRLTRLIAGALDRHLALRPADESMSALHGLLRSPSAESVAPICR
ncbi:hypothetical protein [Streptomyces sp. NPDC058011]|uniref:hypothetical protein n=1 Tax=Streptomyces sp. NPDC058011 TaxID=3346305 RepID=UPI0036E4A33B